MLDKVFFPKEDSSECRIAATPSSVEKLCSLGIEVSIQKGLGEPFGWSDEDFHSKGAFIETNVQQGFKQNYCILSVAPLVKKNFFLIQPESLHIAFIDPFHQKNVVMKFLNKKIKLISMHLIPRTSVAQKMDALSSQNNLDGYASVILAAQESPFIFPMMTTASGSIFPLKVLVIGAGIAGLQAIATAKRLGAQVEAYDTRPHVAEQIQSLGAKFISFDCEEPSLQEQTQQGYAKKQSQDQIKQQQKSLSKILKQFHVIISTAKIFGSTPPLLITKEMLSLTKKGAVLIDFASKEGGTIEGSILGEKIENNGVFVIGYSPNIHGYPRPASEMYAMNLYYLLEHLWDREKKECNIHKHSQFLSQIMLQSKEREG